MTPLERLTAAVEATEFSIGRVEQCFNQFNEPKWPELLAQPLGLAKEYLAINRSLPTPSVAEDYVDLAGILGEIEWPTTGTDPINDARVFDLQDRVNRLVLNCLTIVSAAKEMGIGYAQPTSIHPDGLQVPRTGQAATLAAIAGHVDDLEFQLNQLVDSRNDSAATKRQRAIVETYRQVVASNIHKIRAAIQTGSTLALEVLDRTGGALVAATRQFVATVRAGASRATPALRTAAKAMSKPVQGMVRSVGAIVKRILGEVEQPVPPLPDDYVDQAKAMILAGKAPPAHWVPHLTDLDFRFEELSQADPLAGLIALQSLILWNTNVSDLTPLAGLTSLEHLDLMDTQASDLSPLVTLTALHQLDLMGTQVSDLAPLANLKKLHRLMLNYTQVSDLTPLAGLAMLKFLDLADTQVSDLTPLAQLEKLEILNLNGTKVSNFSPIANLTTLEGLNLSGTMISDLSLLANLTALETLNLGGTKISDFSLLADLKGLRSLSVVNTQISNLTLLVNLTELQSLNISGTQVSDLAPLAKLNALKFVYLGHTRADDISSLTNLNQLHSIDISYTSVKEITALANLKQLQSIDVGNTQVSDISPLANLANILRLGLRSSKVTDITPLTRLTSLRELSLIDTAVSDLGPVSRHPDLLVTVQNEEHAEALRKTLHEGSQVRVVVPDYFKPNAPMDGDPAS